MMLYKLYDLAFDANIMVECHNLPRSKSLALVLNSDCVAIAIDPMQLESTNQETVQLAHELGHCLTGSFYNKYSEFDIIGKHEYRADKWAITNLVPIEELCFAVGKGLYEHWELSEYFGITDELMCKAIEYYQNQGIVFIKDRS